MDKEEIKYDNRVIEIEERNEVKSSYKIKSYSDKIDLMERKKIPQKSIKEVINHLLLQNTYISDNTKKSILKVISCQKDKIIVVLTDSGQEIIWNRDKLIHSYGWFFFVEKPKKKSSKSKKEKPVKQPEKTISREEYNFEDIVIKLKEKENMRALYHTKEYAHYLKIIRTQKIPHKPIQEVLEDFFNKNQQIPIKEKKAIGKIIYYQKERVIVVKSLIGDQMYENLEKIVKKYGWYFYITGVPVGQSDISLAIDKIERRFDMNYFQDIEVGRKPKITIYPIVLKPNHNCHILGAGNLNILLDCGISERKIVEDNTEEEKETKETGEREEETEKEIKVEMDPKSNDFEYIKPDDFEHIEHYLTHLPELILKAEREKELKVATKEGNVEKENILSKPIEIVNEKGNNYKIDAIYVSHSHFDHISGLKKLIERYPDVPILCSRITLDLFLLRDSNFLKQETHDEIEEVEYRNIIQNVIYVENGDKIEFKDKDCFLSFFHGGHMPGALMVLARIKDFRFLYTGDYTYHDITPFAGTRRFLEQISRPIDYLLIDGTSSMEDFGNISDQFHSLILFLEQKAEMEDNVLIGADPSSLAISFMLTFWRYFRKQQLRRGNTKRPNIYVDMMVRKNIQVINHRYEYIHGPISRLIRDKANPFNSIKFRWFDRSDLEFLRKKNNIIISHPPDLSYGIIRNIINVIGRNPHNLVFLAGSIHEHPGIDIVEGGKEMEFSETWKAPFRAFLINTFFPQLKIKLHADKNQLTEMIKMLEPKEVCFFHQSPKNLIGVVDYVKELGVDTVSLPKKRILTVLN